MTVSLDHPVGGGEGEAQGANIYLPFTPLFRYIFFNNIFNRPGVAGAVLLTPPSIIPFPPFLQNTINPKPLELVTWHFYTVFTPLSGIMCHVSPVTCHMSRVTYIYIYSPTLPSWPRWSSSRDVRVFVSLFVPFPCDFVCVVGLVESVPHPWTGRIWISSRALKRGCVPEFDLE